MPGMSVTKQLIVALLLLGLCVGFLAIDPADPDSVAPAVISVCGSDLTEALFTSSQQIRTLLATSWGLGLSAADFTSSLKGIHLFSYGTCDVLVTISPLSESQAMHLVRDLNRTIVHVPFAVGSLRLVHSWQTWGTESQELHMTPDVLADVYQCNISHLDDPRIQTLNPNLRLEHIPIIPLADRGGGDASILMRTLAQLAPSWRTGIDFAKELPACVAPALNVTYKDFQRNDTFYIGLGSAAFDFADPPAIVLQLPHNSTNASAGAIGRRQMVPLDGSSAQEWAAYTLISEDTGSGSVRELRSLDFLMFYVFDHDSNSRGYPIGCQIRQLGEVLLSDNIQSQLPAYDFRPLSSLHLPPSTIQGYEKDVASVLCKSTPDMPNTILRAEGVSEQLAIAGWLSFTGLMSVALKPFSKSRIGWAPFGDSVHNGDLYKYAKRTVDLLILDSAITSDVLLAKDRVGEGLVQVPFAMDAAMIAHSIPGVAADDVCLDAETISDVLQCRITTWDHQNISALNPGNRLPNQAINVMIDPLNFGLVHTISKYLDELAPGWKLGKEFSIQWPPCVSLDMSATNNQSRHFETPYAFGFRQTTAQDEPILGRSVRVMNRKGLCVSPRNLTAASLESLIISSIAPHQWENFTTASSDDPGMYPLGMMGFIIWDLNSTNIGYEEGRSLKNVTSWLLSKTVQDSMPQHGLVPAYQDASAQIQQTIVQATPDVDRIVQPGGVPVNDTIIGCSNGNAYNSFQAIYWQMNEAKQGRPFLLDTTYGSDATVLHTFLNGHSERAQGCDFALVWNPMPVQQILTAPRRVLHIPMGFAPLPIIHNFQGIPDNALRLDAHALAGLYSCKIRSFDGYIRSLNPNLTLPSGNITVVAMPRSTSTAQHLVNYIKQDSLWDAGIDRAPGWPACIWETKIKPTSGQVSRLMLENPDSIIGFQPFGHFLTVRILAEQARVANQTEGGHDVDRPASDVWSRVLHGMWKAGSALPLERGVMVQNAKGDFMAANPVTAIDFPFTKEELPNTFSSPAWGALQDPTNNTAPNAYPIGQLMFVITDEDIGAQGRVHAKRMKSFLRYLVTENAAIYEAPAATNDNSLDNQYQEALLDSSSIKELPDNLKLWALQGINQLSYEPLPPLPRATKPAAPGLLGRLRSAISSMATAPDVYVDKHLAVGLAVGIALLVGLIAAGLLIWQREHQIRHNSMNGACSLKMGGSENVPSNSPDLKLELDGKGEPVLLGQGSFAKVYKGRWNGVLVAVKVLNAPAAEVMEDFQRECAILERLRHPNIIKYFGMASNAEGHVMMVTEYMQGGDLGTALANDDPKNRRLGWYNSGNLIALKIARGLAYLHAQKVISFDVKPANVLLDRTGRHAKLADVGLAKVLEHSQTMTNMRGTLDYMPPEMFGAYEDEEENGGTRKQPITQAVDVYSFGLVLWQIVTGGSLDKMQGSLRIPRVPDECPAEIVGMYTACLSELPAQRPKAADLVKVIIGSVHGGTKASIVVDHSERTSSPGSGKSGRNRILASLGRQRQ